VPAAVAEVAYRPLEAGQRLEQICCFKYVRVVGADNTVTLGPTRLQIQPGPARRSYAQASVEVHERLDGSLVVCYGGQVLLTQPAPAEAPLLRARPIRRAAPMPRAGPRPVPCGFPSVASSVTPQEDKITGHLSGHFH
jgi:hypothetical protein